jgi:hypothetical protein
VFRLSSCTSSINAWVEIVYFYGLTQDKLAINKSHVPESSEVTFCATKTSLEIQQLLQEIESKYLKFESALTMWQSTWRTVALHVVLPQLTFLQKENCSN